MKFIKKPVVIEAMQLTEQDCWDSWLEHKPFFGKFTVRGNYHPGNRMIGHAWISIETLEGVMRAEIGDWIICGVAGEFYPCKNDIFENEFVEAEVRALYTQEQMDKARTEAHAAGAKLRETQVAALRAQVAILRDWEKRYFERGDELSALRRERDEAREKLARAEKESDGLRYSLIEDAAEEGKRYFERGDELSALRRERDEAREKLARAEKESDGLRYSLIEDAKEGKE